MFRIVTTSHLAHLEAHASALPMARSKCEGLEQRVEDMNCRVRDLEGDLEQATERLAEELAALTADYESRLAAAARAAHRTNELHEQVLDRARARTAQAVRLADETARELRAEIERLEAKLALSPVQIPDGVVARYLNLVGASVDVTLYVDSSTEHMRLVLLCTGCGYTQERDRYLVDSPDSRAYFVTADYSDGATIKRWAQEHAAKCRAVALDPASA
ncbi:hypothetical protein [Streptomyces sp. NPDC017941]|uniref:hypothetical protein n=1 Tax=unclassified Streptomyces TaxID=2593676 RepID=UPI00379BC337